eukprot:jgi/Chrzof1/526/Cz01g19020.t1
MFIGLLALTCALQYKKIKRVIDTSAKRLKGMPTTGPLSIVVTDIEGYSDLFKQSPELMQKALDLHNAVIRKAKYTTCGSTLEQEGDSYILGFHEAYDAVAFCLQVESLAVCCCSQVVGGNHVLFSLLMPILGAHLLLPYQPCACLCSQSLLSCDVLHCCVTT